MSKRDSLIAATKALITDRGYQAVSPRRIQAEAGAGQGSFYHHFSGKLDLAAAALREVAAEMRGDFDLAVAGAEGLDGICAWLEMPRDGLAGSRVGRLAAEAVIEEPVLRNPVESYFAYVESTLADLLEEAMDRGEIRSESSPEDLAAALVATVEGGYVLARVHQDPAAMERALRGALNLLASTARE